MIATYVALLRGINVGKHNRIPMADLRDLVAGLGFAQVRTHLNSGNVVFDGEATSPASIAASLTNAIHSRFGLDVGVLVRGGEAMQQVVADNPFPERAANPKTLHVEFLAEPLPPDAVRALEAIPTGDDDWRLIGPHLYLAYPNGLSNATFVPNLPGLHTSRNWNTVDRLARMVVAES